MKNLKVYNYARCGSCIKAKKFLKTKDIPFEDIPILETPPSREQLRQMLEYVQSRGGTIRNLFNTSGKVYKEMGISKKIHTMTETEMLDLLASNGALIKRPFVWSEHDGWVGFKEEEWEEKLKK